MIFCFVFFFFFDFFFVSFWLVNLIRRTTDLCVNLREFASSSSSSSASYLPSPSLPSLLSCCAASLVICCLARFTHHFGHHLLCLFTSHSPLTLSLSLFLLCLLLIVVVVTLMYSTHNLIRRFINCQQKFTRTLLVGVEHASRPPPPLLSIYLIPALSCPALLPAATAAATKLGRLKARSDYTNRQQRHTHTQTGRHLHPRVDVCV